MSEYSLTDERDEDGNRRPVDHTFMYAGSEKKIKILPPTISQVERFEEMEKKDETSIDELMGVFGEHVVKPDIDDPTMREAEAMAEGLLDYIENGNQLAQDAQEELNKRGDSGN